MTQVGIEVASDSTPLARHIRNPQRSGSDVATRCRGYTANYIGRYQKVLSNPAVSDH